MKGEEYTYQSVGNILGWLCIEVPRRTITVFLFLMIFSCFIEKNEFAFTTKQKIYCVLLICAVIVLIETGLFLSWTTVGADLIEGVQGRYFIPILFLLLLCFCKKDNYIKIKNVQYKLPIALLLLNISPLYAIYKFFL